jgi:hypothetical protein
MQLFAVEIRDHAAERIDEREENRWLTEREIRAGRSEDGQPISPTMARLAVEGGLFA